MKIIFRPLIRSITVTFLVLVVSKSGGRALDTEKHKFDFESFDKLQSGQDTAAQNFLRQLYPAGSDALTVVGDLRAAGAKCQFAEDRGYFYFCVYTRRARGIMALVASIEWHVIVNTDKDGKIVSNISVVRGLTGN